MYQPSTPPSVTPHSGRTALIHGILAGLILGIVESIVIVYFTRDMNIGPYAQLSIPFSLLFWIVILLLSGAIAGKRTGKIATGTLAGLWAGMVGGIITAVTWFTMLMASAYSSYYYPGMMATNLTYMILLILAALGIGTGLGALGGLIGQSFAPNTQTALHPYQQSGLPQAYQPSSQRSDPPQTYQPSQRSDPPQQEQEMVQYQQNSAPQQEPQD